MAAQDQKISNNRRKLFKALSAAPVVMTLRPGSALANSSAFQCLQTAVPDTNFYHADTTAADAVCGENQVCFVYRERSYWIPKDGTKVTDSGSICNDLSDEIIVETRPGEDYFVLLDGTVVTSRVSLDGTRSILELSAAGDPPQLCYTDVPKRTGLFLLVGQPNAEHDSFSDLGVYPEKTIVGTQQGITGTCLASIPNDVVGVIGIAQG